VGLVSRIGATLPDAFAFRAADDPDRECLVDVRDGLPTRRFSYAELDRAIDDVAAGLAAVGVGRGDRVVLRLRNTAEFVLALIGALRAGAIAVPTIRQYSPEELRFALEDSEAACLIFDDDERAPIEGVVPAGVTTFHAEEALEAREALAGLRGAEASGEERGIERPPGDLDAFEDAVIFYTSGTTSRPKGVVLSHGAILDACLINAEGWRLRAGDRSYVVLPLFHCNALFMQLTPALLSGATAILGDRYSASRYLDECREHRVTLANLTAGAIRSLLAQPPGPGDCEHEIRLLTFGLPLHGEEIEAAEARYGFPVRMAYGLTESAAGGTRGPLHLDPRSGWQSLGPAQSGWDVAIADARGNFLPAGEVGEILLRGPGLMDRYWRRPDLTAEALRDGWLRTGDLGSLDEAGFAHFHSREKDMLKPKGENVAASEIELALERHPAVAEAAAVGLFDPHHEERVVAVVAGERCADAELSAHCAGLLAPFKVPTEFVWVEELPKTSIGKINKGEIKVMLGAR
jgi:acyl-CoA synthetase (AMP-forming)/AMP-acid ligase II